MTAKLEAYVRNGGTLVLVSHSGQHSYRERDAWPSTRLTGCRVTGTRPLPTGGAWYRFAEKPSLCATLAKRDFPVYLRPASAWPLVTPGDDVEVLARFTNDQAPAMVRRPLGKGQVIWGIASAVWERSDVLGTLLDDLQIRANATANIWTESFISNDGTEEMVVAAGDAKRDTPVKLTWQPGFAPRRVFDPISGEEVSATITGESVALPEMTVPASELRFVAARRPVTAAQAFAHWLRRQGEIWQGSAPAATPPKIAPFRLLNLANAWQMAQCPSPAALAEFRQLSPAAQAAQLKPTTLTLWKDAGLPVGSEQRGVYRRTFTLTPQWLANSQQSLSMNALWPFNGLPGGGEVWVNGKKLGDLRGLPFQGVVYDVTGAVKAGDNVLEIIASGSNDNGGFAANVVLQRTLTPRRTLDLAGTWQGVVSEDSAKAVTLPGPFSGVYVYRDVEIPADLAGKEVWIRVETADTNSSSWVAVNGRVRYLSYFGTRSEQGRPLEINITPDLQYGKTNRIVIGTAGFARDDWKAVNHTYARIMLHVYNLGDWDLQAQR